MDLLDIGEAVCVVVEVDDIAGSCASLESIQGEDPVRPPTRDVLTALVEGYTRYFHRRGRRRRMVSFVLQVDRLERQRLSQVPEFNLKAKSKAKRREREEKH